MEQAPDLKTFVQWLITMHNTFDSETLSMFGKKTWRFYPGKWLVPLKTIQNKGNPVQYCSLVVTGIFVPRTNQCLMKTEKSIIFFKHNYILLLGRNFKAFGSKNMWKTFKILLFWIQPLKNSGFNVEILFATRIRHFVRSAFRRSKTNRGLAPKVLNPKLWN